MSSEDEDRWFCPPRSWRRPACLQSMPELPSLESFQLLSLGYAQWVMPACEVHRSPGCALTVIGVAIADACVQMLPYSLSPWKAQQRGPGGSRCKGLENKEAWEYLWPKKPLASEQQEAGKQSWT